MPGRHIVELLPAGRRLEVEDGVALADILFPLGVEFPCGGRGKCRGCRVKVLEGQLSPTPEEERLLDATALAQGWRLSCRHRVHGSLRLEMAQWESAILSDDQAIAFVPQQGLGVAVDVGTTTLAAQLVDLRNAHVLAVQTALNAQARHGADIMSRVDYAVSDGGATTLTGLLRQQIGCLIQGLFEEARAQTGQLRFIALVGNTVMHHSFCGLDLAPLASVPFEPKDQEAHFFTPAGLGWPLPPSVSAAFLPCLGGFVGSDLLAGIVATGLWQASGLNLLIDLGTNGEIVLGGREGILCASTAAGPAFEGARISCGMRAAMGAISAVTAQAGQLQVQTLGHAPARGVCGSGLVDAVAAALDLGWLHRSGRLVGRQRIDLAEGIALTQQDIRELQLAKGAIAAGIKLLLQEWGAAREAVDRVWLAGAFGNYISRASARRIGLLPFPLEKVTPAGNTALRGAKQALFQWANVQSGFPEIRSRCRHISLHELAAFQETFAEEMLFPELSS